MQRKAFFSHSHQHKENPMKEQHFQQSVPSGLFVDVIVSLQTLDLLLIKTI